MSRYSSITWGSSTGDSYTTWIDYMSYQQEVRWNYYQNLGVTLTNNSGLNCYNQVFVTKEDTLKNITKRLRIV